MRRFVLAIVLLAIVGAGVLWVATIPKRVPEADIAALSPGDAVKGERIFWAGGCAACHARPQSQGDARLELAGGLGLVTPFGTFVAPNISSHPTDGVGGWSVADLATAMKQGTSPDGRHYFPAFPYASYARMALQDIADLHAFMQTLPAVEGRAPDHELGFPFNIRRGVGVWKILHLSPDPVLRLPQASDQIRIGQYLVEGPGHCGECHTRRDVSGGIVKADWLAGAVAAEGEGTVPNITPSGSNVGSWSEADIAGFLKTGDFPDFSDSVGGSMADVVRNLSMLSDEDRAAIAAYLKAVPARPNGYPAR